VPTATRYTTWITGAPSNYRVFDGNIGEYGPTFGSAEEAKKYMEETVISVTVDGSVDAGSIVTEGEAVPARRKRRTKAEMEAARLAAENAPGTAIVPAAKAVEPALEAKAEGWAKEARDLLTLIAAADIETQADMDELGTIQRQAFTKGKELTEERLKLTRPIDATKTGILNLFKPAIGYWGAIEEACKQKIQVFREAAKAEQDAALAAVAAAGGEADPSTLVVAHGQGVLSLPATSGEKIKYTWTTSDEKKVPDEYKRWVLDTEKIDLEVDRKGLKTEIPGIRVEREVQIVNKPVRK
jgi:hypothetical protein